MIVYSNLYEIKHSYSFSLVAGGGGFCALFEAAENPIEIKMKLLKPKLQLKFDIILCQTGVDLVLIVPLNPCDVI